MSWELISVYEYIWIGFGIFSFILHILTLYIIFQAKWRKSDRFFKGPFFTIVLVQGFHECLIFLTINVLNRGRKYRLIYYEVVEDNLIYEWEWYWFIFLRMLLYFGHVQIAANRFTAFFSMNMKTYDRVWNSRTIAALTLIAYFVAAVLRFAVYSPDIYFRTNIEPSTGLFGAQFPTWLSVYDSLCDINLSIGCAIICALLYMASAWRARTWKLPIETKKHEVTMLWCGFLTFLIVVPSAGRSAIEFIANRNLPEMEDLRKLMSRGNSYPTEAMSVFQPYMLLLSCPSLRKGLWRLSDTFHVTDSDDIRISIRSHWTALRKHRHCLSMSWNSISSWECLWVVYSLFSSATHSLLLYTIVKAKRTRASSLFSGPFFTICLIQGTHELIMFLTTNLMNRPRKYRLMEYALVDDNHLVEWEYYWFVFFRNNLYLGHLLVAVNRMSAFSVKSMGSYDKVWSTRNILTVTVLGYILNIGLRLIEYSPDQQYTPFVDNVTDLFSFHIAPSVVQFDAFSEIILSVGTALVCVICYFLAACQAKKSGNLVTQYKKQEVMLLRVGVVTFLMFLPAAIRSILALIGMALEDKNLQLVTARASSICIEVMFVFHPWLLLAACTSLRERVMIVLGIQINASRRSFSNGSQEHYTSTNHRHNTVSIVT